MKVKIALRNLYISQAIIFVFLIFAYFVWFPYSFSKLEEFYKTAGLLIFVDLILGPVLVLIIYNENKKHLKFDINVLLTIQLIAFIFGAHSLYLKHPVYAVFAVDRFTLINAANTTPEKIRFNALRSNIFSKTKMIVAKMPSNLKEKNALTMGVFLNGKPDLDQRAEFYELYTPHIVSVLNKSLNFDKLIITNKTKNKLNSFINKHGGDITDYAYLPLQTKYKDVIWVLNKKTALPVGLLDIDPWTLNEKLSLSKK